MLKVSFTSPFALTDVTIYNIHWLAAWSLLHTCLLIVPTPTQISALLLLL